MNVKQIKRILNKALFLICSYEGRKLTDDDYEKLTEYISKAVSDSKGNEYCQKIMLDVLECFDREEQRK